MIWMANMLLEDTLRFVRPSSPQTISGTTVEQLHIVCMCMCVCDRICLQKYLSLTTVVHLCPVYFLTQGRSRQKLTTLCSLATLHYKLDLKSKCAKPSVNWQVTSSHLNLPSWREELSESKLAQGKHGIDTLIWCGANIWWWNVMLSNVRHCRRATVGKTDTRANRRALQ